MTHTVTQKPSLRNHDPIVNAESSFEGILKLEDKKVAK